jgi:hypothetical protein
MIRGTQWLAGVAIYIAISVAVYFLFVYGLRQWAFSGDGRPSWAEGLEALVLARHVFLICLFWAALYASALAKPACFGFTARILKHMAWSCGLGILGSALILRILFVPLPDFKSRLAVSTFLVIGMSVSILAYALGLAVWIRLAFGSVPPMSNDARRDSSLKVDSGLDSDLDPVD